MTRSSPLPPRPRVCLNMIVKDESAVIERCLDSVLPFIDTWVIVDTGSSDGTQDLIVRKLAALPGQLHQRPWVNFGHNRSEAAALAQDKADYLLFFDADDVLKSASDFVRPQLVADAYQLWLEEGDVRYTRMLLVSTRLIWRWTGVVHEYPSATPPVNTIETLSGLTVASGRGGARSADAMRYQRDAALLEEVLKTTPDDPRSVFYLAQSYRDAGLFQQAFDAYERRAAIKGWDEETWYAMWQAARMGEFLGHPWSQTVDRYLSAFQFRPTRVEPLVDLARAERDRGQFARAFVFAMTAQSVVRPLGDVLFVDEAAYSWRAADELAVASYWIGRFDLSREKCTALLANKVLPSEHRARVESNLAFANAELAKIPVG